MKIIDDDPSTCREITDDGEKLVWLPLDKISESNIRPSFIKHTIDRIIGGDQIIHVIQNDDK